MFLTVSRFLSFFVLSGPVAGRLGRHHSSRSQLFRPALAVLDLLLPGRQFVRLLLVLLVGRHLDRNIAEVVAVEVQPTHQEAPIAEPVLHQTSDVVNPGDKTLVILKIMCTELIVKKIFN